MTDNLEKPLYKRILLKISGEMLMGKQEFGIDRSACRQLAKALSALQRDGMQIAVVIGGGNIFRGIRLEDDGVERSAADQMGMLATLINGISLREALLAIGTKAKVMTALECPKVAEAFDREKALESLNGGTLLIFVGGTGNPYFTTDSAAALRACEIDADILAKATKVDGIYTKDPIQHPDAIKYDTLTYSQALSDRLGVMDATALALCRSNRIPIFVFNMHRLSAGLDRGSELFDPSRGTLVTEN